MTLRLPRCFKWILVLGSSHTVFGHNESCRFFDTPQNFRRRAEVARFTEWADVLIASKHSSPQVKTAAAVLRDKLAGFLESPGREDVLQRELQKAGAFTIFETPLQKDWREADQNFYLNLLADPEFEEAMVTLGEAEAKMSFPGQKHSLLKTLRALIPFLQIHSSDLGNFVLNELASKPQLLDHAQALDYVRRLATAISEAKSKRMAELQRFFPQLPPETASRFAEGLAFHPHSRYRELITHLFGKEWFLKQNATDRKKIFFLLNYLAHLSENSPSSHVKRLMRNTLDTLLQKNIVLISQEMKEEAHWISELNTIAMSQARLHHLRPMVFGPDDIEFAVGTLSHEVSHILSGQTAEKSVAYFIEEYRAWQVGLAGILGELPTRYEQFAVVAELLAGTDQHDSYQLIAHAWKKNPEDFFPFLAEFEFGDPKNMIGMTGEQLNELADRSPHRNQASPQWGWEGYLWNEAPPAEAPLRGD